jgi:hypothetical protein
MLVATVPIQQSDKVFAQEPADRIKFLGRDGAVGSKVGCDDRLNPSPRGTRV